MKIAAITLYPPKKAGSAFYSFNLYKEIAKYFEVVILTDETPNQTGTMKVIKAWNRNSILLPLDLFKKIYRTKPSICHFQIEYRPFNDNAILSTLDALLIVALTKIANLKAMITLHGVIYSAIIEEEKIQFLNKTLSKILLVIFYNLLSLSSTKLVVHNQITQNVLQEEYKISKKKIAVIPHGVIPAKMLHKRSKDGIIKIFFHGFVRPKKGLECLLRAIQIVVASYKNVKLIIAGGPPFQESVIGESYIDRLRKMILTLRLGNHVEIKKGFISENDLDKYISSSDILVFPYIDHYLESSGSIARIMDYGVPIVCSKIPRFLADLQSGKECLMVTPNNEKELAEALMNLVDNQELRQKISENLRKKAKSRYWHILAKEYVKLFKEEKHE